MAILLFIQLNVTLKSVKDYLSKMQLRTESQVKIFFYRVKRDYRQHAILHTSIVANNNVTLV